jgi:hypothetical protein
VAIGAWSVHLDAHGGSPYPVLTDQTVAGYTVSLWADPDASADGDADGRFWVLVKPSAKGTALPADTVVQISLWPVEHRETVRTEIAKSDEHEPSRRTVAFVIDHEGKYGVMGNIAGSLGPAQFATTVDAEFAERPGPILLAVYPMPFVLIGFVWIKLLLRRRAHKLA